ncbi:MAG TPA: single-stranded DNA-binding protein [Thermoanaerobaculia bacterium]|nr:single-stranded DNA-binding protein [Thermoanaerobaculia bacterium]
MLNKVFLIGNLGRDPEVRTTTSGQPVASFSVATSRRWKDRDGNRQEHTEWHNVVCWGKQAEIAGQYLSKGKQVFIEGRLQTRSWDDKQSGEKKYKTEIIVENFNMLGGRSGAGGGGGDFDAPEPPPGHSFGGGGGGGASRGAGFDAEPDDDDIPF